MFGIEKWRPICTLYQRECQKFRKQFHIEKLLQNQSKNEENEEKKEKEKSILIWLHIAYLDVNLCSSRSRSVYLSCVCVCVCHRNLFILRYLLQFEFEWQNEGGQLDEQKHCNYAMFYIKISIKINCTRWANLAKCI